MGAGCGSLRCSGCVPCSGGSEADPALRSVGLTAYETADSKNENSEYWPWCDGDKIDGPAAVSSTADVAEVEKSAGREPGWGSPRSPPPSMLATVQEDSKENSKEDSKEDYEACHGLRGASTVEPRTNEGDQLPGEQLKLPICSKQPAGSGSLPVEAGARGEASYCLGGDDTQEESDVAWGKQASPAGAGATAATTACPDSFKSSNESSSPGKMPPRRSSTLGGMMNFVVRSPSMMSKRFSSRDGASPGLASPGPREAAPRHAGGKPRVRAQSGNANRPEDYRWLESALLATARNQGPTLGCKDTATGKAYSPMFFCIGGCPNMFCGMQVNMFSAAADGEVDFWWVKPSLGPGKSCVALESQTLSRNPKGPHKNDPGRSKQFYKVLADFFQQEGGGMGQGLRFGTEKVGDATTPRAYIDMAVDGESQRFYLIVVWQEDWTSNPFAFTTYIKGKLLYQKDAEACRFYTRSYTIVNGDMTLGVEEDYIGESVVPDDSIKEIWQ